MVFAATPEKRAIENAAPARYGKLPIFIRGRERAETFLVQFRDSMRFAANKPMDIKKSSLISGQTSLSHIRSMVSGDTSIEKDINRE